MELNPILNFLCTILEEKIFTGDNSPRNHMFKEILQIKNFKKANIFLEEDFSVNLFSGLSFLSNFQDLIFKDSESNFLNPITNPKDNDSLWKALIFSDSGTQALLKNKGNENDKTLEVEVPIKVFFPFDFNKKFIENIHLEIFSEEKKNLLNILFQKASDTIQYRSEKIFHYCLNGKRLNDLNESNEKKDGFNLFLINDSESGFLRDFIPTLFKKGVDHFEHLLVRDKFVNLNPSHNVFQENEENFDKFIRYRVNVFQNYSEYFGEKDTLNLSSIASEDVDKEILYLNISSHEFPNENFLQKKEVPSHEAPKDTEFNIKFTLDKSKLTSSNNEEKITLDQNNHSGNIRLGNFQELIFPDETEASLPSSQVKIEPLKIYQQIGKQIIWTLKNNGEKIRLILDPPELGCIHVEIKNEQRKLELFFWADRAVTKDLLEANRELLVEILRKDGFRLEKLEVFFQQEGIIFQNDRENQIDQNRKFFKETRKTGKYHPENKLEIDPIITKYFSSGSNYIDLTV